MSASIVSNIANWKEVAEHTRALLAARSQRETAVCARGRMNTWLQAQPNYADKTYSAAVTDDRLWTYLKRLCPSADLAQVFGGNVAIDWHRDAAYAHATAWLLALGTSTFEIEDRSGEIQSFKLTGGELLQFDCKCRHRAVDVDPQRIGIGIWQAKIPIPNFST
jgi:hypothetical protein